MPVSIDVLITGSAVDIFIPFITLWVAVKSQRRLVQKHTRMTFKGDSDGKAFLIIMIVEVLLRATTDH